MTAIDEALRALEKEMRTDGWRAEYYAGRLAALLTTRQEVAPVAEVGRDGSIIWLALRMLKVGTKLYTSTGQTSQEVAPVAWMREGATTVMHNVRFDNPDSGPWIPLYTTTGQTSDARDDRAIRSKAALLFFHKLRETSDVHEADASVGIFDASWHCGSSGLSDALNVALDAAMQEAGK